MKMYLISFCLLLMYSQTQGYQYKTFVGPVSGVIKEIAVPYRSIYPHSYKTTATDYVAKPDYSFSYGVEDEESGNTQNHKETRDGDVVRGEYSVVQPDGIVRTVSYTSDAKNGFQATISYKQLPYSPPQFIYHSTSSEPPQPTNSDSHYDDY